MTTFAQWLSAARPRTLPAAVAPVLVGTGEAIALSGFSWWRALLALVVSLALQVGVNYANDYSDGIRGTDAARVGPARLVGSGAARPAAVKAAAFAAFGVAGVAGLVLAAVTTWWLVPVGVVCVLAAWGYTGGPRPYGYAGLGEVFVFVFFGLVAVLGTTWVQAQRVSWSGVVGAVAIGLLACALLVVNNLRDVETDAVSGKRTLAVRIGAVASRRMFAALVAGAFVCAVVLVARTPWTAVALLAVPLAVPPVRAVLAGARGRDLVVALGQTGRLEVGYAVLLGTGLALAAV